MSGYEGNKNAEKWDEKTATAFVDEVYQYVLDNEDCIFIGEPMAHLGYYRELWPYLKNKFDFNTIKRVESILEARLVSKGVGGSSNATMTIFTLKNNYGWKDKTQTELSGKINVDKIPVEVVEPDKG